MGLSILGPGGTGDVPVRVALEIGPGDLFVTLALIYALVYLYLLEPANVATDQRDELRPLLLGVAVPLSVTFFSVLLFTSLTRVLVLSVPLGLVCASSQFGDRL